MNGLRFGQYLPGNSLIHQLDPRTKLVGCLLMMVTILVNSRPLVILANFTVIFAVIVLAGLKWRRVWRTVWHMWLFFALTFIFQAQMTRGEVIWTLGTIGFTREGILAGVETVLRILILLLVSSLLTATTSPIRLAEGLQSLLGPLHRIGVPVHQFAVVISTALRFIPDILQEAETLTRAQQARGAQFSSSNLLIRFQCLAAVLIPLLANSLRRADELALAMESRCFNGCQGKTRLKTLQLGGRDLAVLSVILLVTAISFYLR